MNINRILWFSSSNYLLLQLSSSPTIWYFYILLILIPPPTLVIHFNFIFLTFTTPLIYPPYPYFFYQNQRRIEVRKQTHLRSMSKRRNSWRGGEVIMESFGLLWKEMLLMEKEADLGRMCLEWRVAERRGGKRKRLWEGEGVMRLLSMLWWWWCGVEGSNRDCVAKSRRGIAKKKNIGRRRTVCLV